jgi:hypothetical protein
MMDKIDRVNKFIVCECGDIAHQLVLSWFKPNVIRVEEPDGCVYLTVHLNKLPFWKRLKVAIQYLFGKQSKYGAFDEVIISPSEWRKFKDMTDFMKDAEEYINDQNSTEGLI